MYLVKEEEEDLESPNFRNKFKVQNKAKIAYLKTHSVDDFMKYTKFLENRHFKNLNNSFST